MVPLGEDQNHLTGCVRMELFGRDLVEKGILLGPHIGAKLAQVHLVGEVAAYLVEADLYCAR